MGLGTPTGRVHVQTSAHGRPVEANLVVAGDTALVSWAERRPAVAPGQSVVFYDAEMVLGGGVVTTSSG